MPILKVGKDEIAGLLEGLREKRYTVWAPGKEEVGVDFRRIENGEVPVLNHSNTRLSPKNVIFPQSERMLVFSSDSDRDDAFILKEMEGDSGKQVVFGIRPCDARAFEILDKVFLTQGTVEDPYYKSKRDKTLLLGLGCNEPCATCFCHWTGGGPFSEKGLDVLMTDLGDAVLLQPVSEGGESFIGGLGYPEATDEDIKKKERVAEQALLTMGEAVSPRRIKERDLMELFDDPYWETVHESCIKCGVCTYLCPTCSCFDIQDEVRGACGYRGRNWDTCMSRLTTQHASGHNPRPTGKERFRQRFMHKLKYFQDDFDDIMCVGCGRCIQSCPVNIDIREIIQALSA